MTRTLSGVAAAGAPIIGSVYLKDSSLIPQEIGPNPIDSNGNFSFDVTGLNPPFYLYADGTVAGRSYKLFSATTEAGTANINPLSNLAVAAAVGANNPATAFNNPAGYPITPANLANAIADIQRLLQPILSAYGANVDPITGAVAVGSALDKVFDVVTVSINTGNGVITVTNKTNNTTIATATTTTVGVAHPVIQVPPVQTIADLQAIGSTLAIYAAAWNKPNHATADFDPIVAANFDLHDGFTRTQWINHEVQSTHSNSKQITSITNLTIIGKDTITGDYYINGTIVFSDGSLAVLEETGKGVRFTNEGGIWKMGGNKSKIHVLTFEGMTTNWFKVDNTTRIESGLWIELNDRGNLGLKTATVTGPGLPPSGVTLTTQATTPITFALDPAFTDNTLPTEATLFYVIDDTTIGTIADNATYTIRVYNNSSILVDTRDVIIPKAPFTRSVATYPAYFPIITPPASHNLVDEHIGGSFNFTYAKPAASTSSVNLEPHIEFWGAGNYANYETSLSLSTNSGSIVSGTPAWTPTGGSFYFFAWWLQGRATQYVWTFH